MNKTGIIYATKTKHSQKLAEAIGNALKIKAENITTQPELKGLDLLFIVGGIYGNESLPELLQYVGTLDGKEIKRAALVTSCVSKRMEQASVRKILLEKNIEVTAEFICQGSFLLFGSGHPNEKDVADAVNFASRLIETGH